MVASTPTPPLEGLTWTQFADRIQPGIMSYFRHTPPGELLDPHLRDLAREFQTCALKLEEYLEERGAL